MRLLRSMVIGTLGLVATSTVVAQPPAVLSPVIPAASNPSQTLAPEEAARRLLDLCIDHALGKALIAPAAAQQLDGKGFRITGERLPDRAGAPAMSGRSRDYTVRAWTADGVVGADVEAGNCRIVIDGPPGAPIGEAFKAVLKKPGTFVLDPPLAPEVAAFLYAASKAQRFSWRWRKPGRDLGATMTVFPNRLTVLMGPYAPSVDPD